MRLSACVCGATGAHLITLSVYLHVLKHSAFYFSNACEVGVQCAFLLDDSDVRDIQDDFISRSDFRRRLFGRPLSQ